MTRRPTDNQYVFMNTIDSELVRLAMRIGYAAAWNGLFAEAVTIFRGVSAVRKESELPLLGIAVVGFIRNDLDLAEKALDQALACNANSDIVEAHRGCLLRLQGKEEKGKELLASLENSADSDAKALVMKVKNIPTDELFKSSEAGQD